MNIIYIILFIVLIMFLHTLFLKARESFTNNLNKGTLYLIPESDGFLVPELIKSDELLDTVDAKKYFNKVVVIANAADYKVPSTDRDIMLTQWNNILVQKLGLPVEKWAFVCCSNPKISANTLIDNLTTEFQDLKGFLIDSEDGTIGDFIEVFNHLRSKTGLKYKYGMVGSSRKTLPPSSKYNFRFDVWFSELYTEGELNEYNYYLPGQKSADGSLCPSKEVDDAKQFWKATIHSLGENPKNIVPTVCGSGNCQEALHSSSCFDERLSSDQIKLILANNDTQIKDFGIWYGTGQQPMCQPSKSCLNYSEKDCSGNKACEWFPYKKNPITKQAGVCMGKSQLWGCSESW